MLEYLGYFLVGYAIFAGVLIFLMTFGRSAAFAGTIVERASDFVAGGCLDSALCAPMAIFVCWILPVAVQDSLSSCS
jgi:hypothetical protein